MLKLRAIFQSLSNQCPTLIAKAIFHYNSTILSKLKLKYEAEGNQKALARLKKISPVAWQHIHFQRHFIFADDKIIDLDTIISNVSLGDSKKSIVTKNSPEKLPVPG